MSPAACARERGDERQAPRELRIGLDRRELLDARARGSLVVRRPSAVGREGLEHARQPRPARRRAQLTQRPGRGSDVAARVAHPHELDVERHRLGLAATGREQSLGRLLVPGRVARDARERAREAPRGRRRRAEHRGLAERGLRSGGIARANGPDVGRQEKRARASLVGAEVIGERLELGRERRRVAPVGEHVELQRARGQAPRIERDGPRERLERARRVALGGRLLGDAHGQRRAEPGVRLRGESLGGDPRRRGPCRPSARRRGCARPRRRPRRGAPRRRPSPP